MTNIGTKYILAQKFLFDPYSNTLSDLDDSDNIVRLGSNESRILLILIENSNQVVSRDQLHEYVWRDQGFQVDDSSLTQAISTLRKMLQDSTKSPQFVKTVPKRGYQLISSVEAASQVQPNSDISDVEVEPKSSEPQKPDEQLNVEHSKIHSQINESLKAPPQQEVNRTNNKTPNWLYIIWALTLILPTLAWVSQVPDSHELVKVELDSELPLFVPINQPQIDHWLPIIERCTKAYQKHVPISFKQVIATGGESDHIALNYIYRLEDTNNNKTIVLFANQTNVETLCH